MDPRGGEWTVRRRWVKRRLRWRGRKGHRSIDLLDGADLASLGTELPVVGIVFTAIIIVLAAVAAVTLVVPALIFLLDLLLVVGFVAFALFGRVLLGRPWTVEAYEQGADHAYEWKERGWRSSGEIVSSIAQQLEATGQPTGGVCGPRNAE